MEQEQQQQPLLLASNPPTTTTSATAVGLTVDGPAEINGDNDYGVGPTFMRIGDYAYYSRPFVLLDVLWNFAFVLVALFVLLITFKERPATPLRLWIGGYALQCILHVGFVCVEFQKRSLDGDGDIEDDSLLGDQESLLFSLLCHSSIIKGLESVHTLVSSVWWVFGFYWIVTGGQPLLQDSPRLYWLTVVFLAFDVLFMIFCIAMTCAVFFAVFCCFPVLASVAYAMRIGEGASEDDLRALPKFRYHQTSSLETCDYNRKAESGSVADSGYSNTIPELALHPEDSECCICLYNYVQGAELCTLPCNHHFHHKCISKWLRINATCPLCKCNILRGDMLV